MWDRIKIITSSVWDFVLPFLRQLVSSAGPILAASALQAVQAVADSYTSTTGSGAQKRQAAFDMISADLKSKGITVGVQISSSLVNAAIEVAVQKIKSL